MYSTVFGDEYFGVRSDHVSLTGTPVSGVTVNAYYSNGSRVYASKDGPAVFRNGYWAVGGIGNDLNLCTGILGLTKKCT